MKKFDTKKLVSVAMLSALAYVISFFSIPIQFLSFELKDFIVVITGFIFGPISALFCTVVSAFVEYISFSSTGLIGLIMNIVSTASFACVSAYIYKIKKNMKGAVSGLIVGCVVSTVLMLIWNYFLTPIYTGMPREAVAGMMLPLLLPFNLAKNIVNASVALVTYKPVVTILRKSNMIKSSNSASKPTFNKWVLISGLFFLSSGIYLLYLLNK